MSELPDQQANIMRKVLPFTSALVVIAIIYVGYVFYSRHEDQTQAAQQAAERQAEENRKVAELYGGNELKVLNFYATAGPLQRGESAQLCYGVNNAQSVKIEPDLHNVPAAYSNCVKIEPKKTTTYTLTATDKAGNTQQAVLTVPVE